MRLKPASGLKVRDYFTRQLLPAAGIDVADTDGVPNDPYWQRLLRDGDVVGPDKPPTQEAAALPQITARSTPSDAEQPPHGS